MPIYPQVKWITCTEFYCITKHNGYWGEVIIKIKLAEVCIHKTHRVQILNLKTIWPGSTTGKKIGQAVYISGKIVGQGPAPKKKLAKLYLRKKKLSKKICPLVHLPGPSPKIKWSTPNSLKWRRSVCLFGSMSAKIKYYTYIFSIILRS
jgi:hypothetical protein